MQIKKTGWRHTQSALIGLAPMDGITDAAFRYMVDTYSKPDVLFTEFTSVEGIMAGATAILTSFIYHKTDTPTVAQIFGKTPEAFYNSAILLAEMGFDGIDINMGCPDKNVTKKGGGAALIQTPHLAQEIIKRTMQAVTDWKNGKGLNDTNLPDEIKQWVGEYIRKNDIQPLRRQIPVSVKTRTGYDRPITQDWIKTLLETNPAAITLHGRTLKQLYTGMANWEEIEKGARLCDSTETAFLGNGDIQSLQQAKDKIRTHRLNGVLVGRATFGNPWFFSGEDITLEKRIQAIRDHTHWYNHFLPDTNFMAVRKHIGWYCKHFPNAVEIRTALMRTKTPQEVEDILKQYNEIEV